MFTRLLAMLAVLLVAGMANATPDIGNNLPSAGPPGYSVDLTSTHTFGDYIVGNAMARIRFNVEYGSTLIAQLFDCETRNHTSATCDLIVTIDPAAGDQTGSYSMNRRFLLLQISTSETAPDVTRLNIRGDALVGALPNVLFVLMDDLNNYPGERYIADITTPNLDRVAALGVEFKSAHAAVPLCSPSRVALIMGIGPTTSGIIANGQTNFRANSVVLAEAQTVFRTLQLSGYRIAGTGKLFHRWATPSDYDNVETPWDAYIDNDGKDAPTNVPTNGLNNIVGTDPDGNGIFVDPVHDWGPLEDNPGVDPDETSITSDSQRATWAAGEIADASNNAGPVMVSLGLFRPHLPNYCPNTFVTGVALPVTVPGVLATDLDDIPNPDTTVVWDAEWSDLQAAGLLNEAAQGYMACVEFADAMLGIALDAIDASPEPWLIVVAGDHGYHIGEKNTWEKLTPWDRATRTTLIISGPDIPAGETRDSAVSLVDIYPTLCDYTGAVCPSGLEGLSLRGIVDNDSTDASVRIINSSDQSTATSTIYVSKRWTYIVGAVTTELYDKDADPNQYANLDFPTIDPQFDDVKATLMAGARP